MIEYFISDNGKAVRLTVVSLSPVVETLEYVTESGYTLTINPSGINKLESDYGQTIIWLSDKWTEQTVTLKGYVAEDRNNYYQRINEVMEIANTTPGE